MELIELLRQLQIMIEEAPSKAFSHKVVLDKEEVLKIISEIKSIIPEEVKQADWINRERIKIINDAKKEANEIIEGANKHAEKLVHDKEKYLDSLDKEYQDRLDYMIESNEVVKKAQERAEVIRQKSEKYKLDMIDSSHLYAEDILSTLEEKLEAVLGEVKANKEELKRR